MIPQERVVIETVEEEVIEEVKERGFMGIGGRTRQVPRTVTRQRERKVTEHARCKVEVYSLEGVEFKLVQVPERPLAIGQTQVTQALWRAVTGKSPSHFKGDQRPVEQVSWEDCIGFCNQLSEKLGLRPAYRGQGNKCEFIAGANGFRLPLEAEREHAARGGQKFEYAGSDNLDEVGWYSDNAGNETHPIAQKRANGYQLYDMSGNVWEWCADDYKNQGTQRSGAGQLDAQGGSWGDGVGNCRVACRNRIAPNFRYLHLGLRLSRSLG